MGLSVVDEMVKMGIVEEMGRKRSGEEGKNKREREIGWGEILGSFNEMHCNVQVLFLSGTQMHTQTHRRTTDVSQSSQVPLFFVNMWLYLITIAATFSKQFWI